MNQEIARAENRLPTPDRIVGEITRTLVCFMPDDPRTPAELTRSLSATERRQIEARIADLEARLALRDDAALKRAIGAMLLGFPSARASSEEAAVVVSAYVVAVSDQPPWAVNEAARRWMRGEAGGNPAFPPSSAELHQAADKVLVPVRAEIFWLNRALNGTVIDRRQQTFSRERRKALENHAMSLASATALEERAAKLGLDPKATLAGIPDAPPRAGDMPRLAASALKSMPAEAVE